MLLRYLYFRWNSQFRKGKEEELVKLAGIKLAKGVFDPKDMDHVLAVLSQRISIDTVLVGSEALRLADRSVGNHMRLLTGISHKQRTFQIHAPSEPMLALGAARLLYTKDTVLGQVLDTFSDELCEAGLVDKGLLGELAARILLTVARDLAAPKKLIGSGQDLLKPVLLMDFLDKLFGNNTWCSTNNRDDFNKAFKDTYINLYPLDRNQRSTPSRPISVCISFCVAFPTCLLSPTKAHTCKSLGSGGRTSVLLSPRIT